MTKLQRLILRLYPRAWRDRYVLELEGLLQDTPTRPGDAWDLFWNAMIIRFSIRTLLSTILGATVFLSAAYLIDRARAPYESHAIFLPAAGTGPREINQRIQQVLNRNALKSIIETRELYDTTALPMEDLVERMRSHSIKVGPVPQSQNILLVFQHPDPAKTQAVTTEISHGLVANWNGMRLIGGASPAIPASVNRSLLLAAMLLGCITGIVLNKRLSLTK